MPAHHEKRVLPYTPEQMFDLVIAVDKYPEFLPWCLAARITDRKSDWFNADLLIGFKMLREKFGSEVSFRRPHVIDVEPTSGPFRYMTNRWRFEPVSDGKCLIDFQVEFEFRSRLLNKMIGTLFYQAVRRMVTAFEGRATSLYGPRNVELERRSA